MSRGVGAPRDKDVGGHQLEREARGRKAAGRKQLPSPSARLLSARQGAHEPPRAHTGLSLRLSPEPAVGHAAQHLADTGVCVCV